MSTQKALLVGIDDYAPAGPGGADLRGCVNDARDMAGTLITLGVIPARPANMRVLTNARATRKSMMAWLEWLVDGSKNGDRLIFYYSGHGSQTVDLDRDEIDEKDETLCPHDFAIEGMISDDDLARVFSRIGPGASLEVILDCCHSGTATRGVMPRAVASDDVMTLTTHPREMMALSSTASGLLRGAAIRYVEPPLDVGIFIDSNPRLPIRPIGPMESFAQGGASTRQPVPVSQLKHTLWAACQDTQLAEEVMIDGIPRGIFTYYFCKSLRQMGASVTRSNLDTAVCTEIKRLGYVQVPQVEGTPSMLKAQVFA